MPAFTFEKISPPGATSVQSATNRPRGVIVQMLDRMTTSRLQREARALRLAKIEYSEADAAPGPTTSE